MLEVEVNPSDVVSIPVDYNNSKMRVCKYKVLGVVDKEHSSDVSLRVVNPIPVDHFSDDKSDSEEPTHCEECGIELEDDESFVCRDCEFDDESRCQYCDQFDCDGECEEEEEEDDEEEDSYPFEDELDE